MSPSSSRALENYSEWLDPRFRQLVLFHMATGYGYASLLLVPKFATVALGAGPEQVGLIAACPVIAAIITAPLCGLWLDRGGYRSAMIAGSLLFAASVVGFGHLRELGPLAYALRFLQGAGNTLIVGGGATLVTRLVPAGHHGRAFGTAGAASLMMNALAASATEHVADAFGWGIAYAGAGAVCVLAFGIAWRQPEVGGTYEAAPVSSPLRHAARRARIGYATVAAGAGFGMLSTFTQPYAISLGAKHVASLFVGFTLTALLVRLGLGGLVDRLGRRRSACVALALYTVTLIAASVLRPEALFALGLGFGVAHGIVWPALSALAVETAPAGRVGSALTRVQGLFAAGAMLAVWLGGQLVARVGYGPSFVAVGIAVSGGAIALAREASD
jgi:MFS family permease